MILAAIDDDLPRMLQNVESSQAKPQLTLRGGQLDLVRRPIKPWWRLTGRPRAALELAASRLALARLARGIANRVSPPDEAADVAGLRPVVAAVVTALRDHLASSQSRLIVVRLPGFARLEPFGSMFRDVTRDAGVPFVDLWEEFDRLSYVEADRLFIGPNHPAELTSNGHFSEAGGRTIAGWLLARGVLPLVR